MKWEPCIIKIVKFDDEDVIRTSGYVDEWDNNGEDPFTP
jgi:hypothetical protein